MKAYQRTKKQWDQLDYGSLADPIEWTEDDDANVTIRSDNELHNFVVVPDDYGYFTYWLLETE